MTLVRLVVLSAFLAGAGAAGAQATAPSSTPTVAKATCVKPDHYPGRLASDNNKKNWQKEVKDWGECMKKYVADLQVQIDAWIKTANASIEDYNAGVKEFQEEVKKASDN
jgi:hypothetical protein